MCQNTSIVLSCESEESTIEFLCDGFNTTPEELTDFFASHLSPYDENEDAESVTTAFFNTFGECSDVDSVYFFHGTRLYEAPTFEEEGILLFQKILTAFGIFSTIK